MTDTRPNEDLLRKLTAEVDALRVHVKAIGSLVDEQKLAHLLTDAVEAQVNAMRGSGADEDAINAFVTAAGEMRDGA